ncbi:MAG: hypothetical protein N3I35_14030 [Clostridia bacterium]|nr:hypothetical protein [Clostridia bacterium]
MKKLLFLMSIAACLVLTSLAAHAKQDYYGYKKVASYDSGKIKVISFSSKWNTVGKLKSVVDELHKNFHGHEMDKLKEIYLYPDQHGSASGDYRYSYTQGQNRKITLQSNNYINLYNCNTEDTIPKIARTLSHEYGHHFTIYYMLQKENKLPGYKNTEYQKVRGLLNHKKINNGEHKWSLAEIAAEDYVAYFGSSTGKTSRVFHDISGFSQNSSAKAVISTDIYNFSPQENSEIQVASNVPKAKQYWLNAIGYKGPVLDSPPSPAYVYVDTVNQAEEAFLDDGKEMYTYILKWTKSVDDSSKNLEYTLVAYTDSIDASHAYPIKTVYDKDQNRTAVVGYYEKGNIYAYDSLLDKSKKYIYSVTLH